MPNADLFHMFENMSSIAHIDHAKYIYISTMMIIHIIYFATFVGVFAINQLYVNYLNVFIQTFVVLFLVARFHPFQNRQNNITSADTTIVFGSAILLGTNLLTVEFAKLLPTSYAENVQHNIKHRIKDIIN